jgi:CBS domain-containing protein/gamma-glutamylcysteine synthetase
MGVQKVTTVESRQELMDFSKGLLNDLRAFEYMLEHDMFEKNPIRIGAEQEMVLVDNKTMKPALINMQVLDLLGDAPWCVTELAKFNLEVNLNPRLFTGSCFADMEAENLGYLKKIQDVLNGFDASIVLCGILPTLRKHDLDLINLTPKERYFALMNAIQKHLIGSSFELRVEGVDELLVKHDSPLLEACNTSFQVHLQVTSANFVQMYNIAQALAGPTIAVGANSPLVFGRRLWHESRIALFQQSLDTRTTSDHMRQRSPRVSFGDAWLTQNISNIYKTDISRFRILLAQKPEFDSLAQLHEGIIPKLQSLQIHNSTVYRWNRPCYGISDTGLPHLRIENRVLPAGPTVADEMANAAFWLGCMQGISDEVPDVTKIMGFADARDNFLKASKFGIDTTFTWFNDKKYSATELFQKELIPLAKRGLKSRKVDQKDIDRFIGIIDERMARHTTGARWALRSYTKLTEEVTNDEALSIITRMSIKNQKENLPVHNWAEPDATDLDNWRPALMKVEEFMDTDLFTVQKDDLLDLVFKMMDWNRIRYIPVENSKGELAGLVTNRLLLRYYADLPFSKDQVEKTVEDIMIKKPITVTPDMSVVQAIKIMEENKIGCLPVVKGKELIGVITEKDFMRITARLLQRNAKGG